MTEQQKVENALTPELWAEIGPGVERMEILPTTKGGMLVAMAPRSLPLAKHGRRALTIESVDEERHAVAALCLYRQPFGFTHEDLDALGHGIAAVIDDQVANEDAADIRQLRSLADRIAALLPPQP